MVGVDGMSGAGKTTFAHRLAAELSVRCIGTDELVPGWDGLAASLDLLVDGVLAPLARGEPARWRRFDWIEHRPAEWVELPATPVVVVEGCCVGVPPVAAYLSLLIWIETPDAERRRRLEEREDWDAYAPFFDTWTSQESAIQAGARTQERADLVVDNSNLAGGPGFGDRFTCR